MATNYKQIAAAAAARYGLDPGVFVRQIQQESGFNPKAGSGAGAQGIAQIMPATARSWGVDPWNPVAALDAAAKNMSKYVKQYKGNYSFALAAYNAGPGAVQKYGGVPPFRETQHYVKTILGGQNPKPIQQGVATKPVVPVKPMAPIDAAKMLQLTPAEQAKYNQLQLGHRDPRQINATEDQRRKLALGGDGGQFLAQAQAGANDEAEQFNTRADEYNRGLKQTFLDDKQAALARARQAQTTAQYAQGIAAGKQAAQQFAPQPGGPAGGSGSAFFRTPNGLVRNQLGTEAPWQFLQRLGQKGFGLRNDPGNSQTYGGRHSAGSEHGWDQPNAAQVGRAVDFGTARNSASQLAAWLKFARANGFDGINEGNHMHVSMPGRGN